MKINNYTNKNTMNSNPFETIDTKLSNIESILQNFNIKSKETENRLHLVKSLASFSGVHELTIRNWISEGKIEAKRIGGRIFIDEAQFIKGLEEVKSLKYKRLCVLVIHKALILKVYNKKDILNKLNFLSKGLKFCKPITGNLLSKIIERLNINSNTLLR